MTRRHFSSLLPLFFCCTLHAWGEERPKHRELRFRIGRGFGEDLDDEIHAVLLSAGESIWQHCPNTYWQVPGFYIYYNEPYPIANFELTADGRIAIGLATKDTYWCQYAFQFAHEFCHALTGHSNDWRSKALGGERPNHWLEESICEVASLFALRAMGKSWKDHPPFVNWKDFAEKLTEYAEERMTKIKSASTDAFLPWFEKHQSLMRKNATMRDHNGRVALELLPLFEKHPEGWEAMTEFKGPKPAADQSLQLHFQQWLERVDKSQKEFIKGLAAVFAIELG